MSCVGGVRGAAARGLLGLLIASAMVAQDDPPTRIDLARQAYQDRLRAFWADVPAEARAPLAFLVGNMPEEDLDRIDAAMLREQVRLALEARAAAPWGEHLPDELFHGYVLPYAQATEARDDWRAELQAKCLPLVRDCRTPGEAALRLNAQVFDLFGVHYSTERRRADQSPSESIAQGKASCTGLSILLAAACRACCVPARLVSVQWPHKPGNHTWVEIWDGEAWRFVGADEPDPQGLDRAWFVGDAARCGGADRDHRIWAVSFAPTGERFRAGWAPDVALWGIDVTDRYAPPEHSQEPDGAGRARARLAEQDAAAAAIEAQIGRFLAADAERRATFEFDRNLDGQLRTPVGDQPLRALLWRAMQRHEQPELQVDHDARIVRAGGKQSPFTVKEVGQKPGGGWPLVIAMHGGGGVPQRINDGQWRHMQVYYKDHPEAGGYLYCALRAPTDEWNGFYTDYFYPLVERLIRQFVVCDDVDPSRVIAIGYSHGGYGAFALGPKLPDLFAAVHASASAPTDGQSPALGLHSLPFSFMVGGLDTAYGRRERCEEFAAELEALQREHPGEYPTTFTLVEGNPHTGLPDRDLLAGLVGKVRCGPPSALRWQLTDAVVDHHYWLHVRHPVPGARIDAQRDGQRIEVTVAGAAVADLGLELWLDADTVNLREPVALEVNGVARVVQPAPTVGTLCRTLVACGDVERAATWVVRLE